MKALRPHTSLGAVALLLVVKVPEGDVVLVLRRPVMEPLPVKRPRTAMFIRVAVRPEIHWETCYH